MYKITGTFSGKRCVLYTRRIRLFRHRLFTIIDVCFISSTGFPLINPSDHNIHTYVWVSYETNRKQTFFNSIFFYRCKKMTKSLRTTMKVHYTASTHTHTHARMHTRTHARAHVLPLPHTRTHSHAPTPTHTHPHTRTPTHAPPHTHPHTRTHTHSPPHTHPLARTSTHPRPRTHSIHRYKITTTIPMEAL